MEWLLGKDLDELTHIAMAFGLPRHTGKQLADWLYKKRVKSIEEMTNLSKTARERLGAHYQVGGFAPEKVLQSVDGTRKYLFPTLGGFYIESVVIPDHDRATLCLSSQAGCKMGCRFCLTARQGFQAHLTAGEMIGQFQNIKETFLLTNAVYMGMGEPLDNVAEVLKSVRILTSDWGWGWSPGRITVSTIGVLPALKRFLDECKCHLAISLHHPFDAERQSLVPMQKVYPLNKILSLIRLYDFSGQRRVSFEYIMWRGVNDSPTHAAALSRLLKGLECRVNLIRYHLVPDCALSPSSVEAIALFQKKLADSGVLVTLRASRGEDIMAACGLLSTQHGVK
ncbi:MAG: 23S rRNA (adenine(2503)-C(2))-methyltransferase RlmN [Prevotellaceae bacterium]|jgi:23S rRNA (adenine2503-C2)-methyltransferase|nr:23S rRNA (adenine(2503)-C(2))-methyltransferase RlmN [Prevotellaceae bacterium]